MEVDCRCKPAADLPHGQCGLLSGFSNMPYQSTTYRITVEPGNWQFTASEPQTVLQSALLAGLELPSSCRNGTCRTCMCRLTQGHIRYQIEWPGVSAEEKSEGYFLPCVAHAQSDLVIEQPLAKPSSTLHVT